MMIETKETFSVGLSSDEARHRLTEHGRNSLPEKPPTSVVKRLIKQFKSPLIYILLFALIVDVVIWYTEGGKGYPVESIAIGVILIVNAFLGVFQEGKSESALAKLKAMATPQAWVVRDARLRHIDSNLIVPGDIVRVEGGDRIPADGRIHSNDSVQVDESILTGESIPDEKGKGDEVFSGTLLQRGCAYIEVIKTGERSAMGRLATMIGGIEQSKTPLEQKLKVFARQVSKLVLGISIFVLIAGTWIQGTAEFGHVMLFAVALAVAAIPEGLPAVLTLTLALGVERMAKRKAVVRRLSAVEALGSVTVIATDKTGTLTENEMNVRGVESPDLDRLLLAMVLANDADLEAGAGDALEIGLLNFAKQNSISIAGVRSSHPRQSTRPFDSSYKFMRVSVREGDAVVSYVKGAPEVILNRCDLPQVEKQEWNRKIESAASEGYRILAFAVGDRESEEALRFLGITLLWDPPRAEVPEAVRLAYSAGIKIVMVTGDHPSTALAVAKAVGIVTKGVVTGDKIAAMSDDELRAAAYDMGVLARVTPEHKLRLVEVLQSGGAVVAMTGDGVNDAPALKKADVGIAMGQRGSDVSREVADIVLADDNFASIISAVEEGRNIFENIQKFIRFLFSTNMAFVLIIVFGSFGSFLLGLKEGTLLLLPMTAVQMLWINIITDGPPALALGFDRNPGVMLLDPRPPSQPLLDRASIIFVATTGLVKAFFGGVILLYGFWQKIDPIVTRTMMFLFQAIAELVIAYPSRRISFAPLRNNFLHVSVLGGIALQMFTVYYPPLRDMLGLKDPGWQGLLFMVLSASVVWLSAEMVTRYEARKANFHETT